MEPSRREWVRSVVEEHQGRLLRYARLLTGDGERARDAVQETFVALCEEDPARVAGYLLPWLFRVCRYRALTAIRKEGRMVSLDQTVARSPGVEPLVLDANLDLEKQQAVRRAVEAMAQLSPLQREALRLRFGEGLSYKEIAQVTRRSVSHVGVLIHEGVKRLRQTVGNAGASPAVKGGE